LNFDGLFDFAQSFFASVLAELALYQVSPAPGLALQRVDGLYSYYDRFSGRIFVAIPDLTTSMGALQKLFMRSLLSCQTDDELLTLWRLLLPHVIAHELGHHLRDHFGQFGENLWHEEQVANELAAAVTKRRLAPAEKERAKALLQRAIAGLAPRMDSKDLAADSYHNILYALEVEGQLGQSPLDNLEALRKAFAVSPEDALRVSGELSGETLQRLERRPDVIASFNKDYASNAIRYFYYHLGWAYLSLASGEIRYVEEFARFQLKREVSLLPPFVDEDEAGEADIRWYFQAHLATQSLSAPASRYFYKRYRSRLLVRLRSAAGHHMTDEAIQILENWQEKGVDALMFAEKLMPPGLGDLLPHKIGALPANPDPPSEPPTSVPETDRRLWQHVALRQADEAAAATLRRLAFLDQSSLLRALSAEVMLKLAHSLTWIALQPGETLIWQGEPGSDMYILTVGALEVLAERGSESTRLARVTPGEVVGELAFLTREPRTATVRAIEPSECLALKASDFMLIGLREPSVLMQMARTLARRLARQGDTATSLAANPGDG